GVMMLGAYGWAFVNPVRKLFYNISITLVSVIVAVLVGALELLSIIQSEAHLSGPFWDQVNFLNNGNDGKNFGYIGGGIIAIFILAWLASTVIYRINRYDQMEARVVVKGGNSAELERTDAVDAALEMDEANVA
ncbi:MAG TPA: hypothetical protein VMV29_06925, partial [Ktedonobacterales bacterium]|nr:hypothetical protein [Ktedonobacterales bacterium]